MPDITEEDREWLHGNTMHAQVIYRCLQDLHPHATLTQPQQAAPEVVSSQLIDILDEAWNSTNLSPLLEVPDADLRKTHPAAKSIPGSLQPDVPRPPRPEPVEPFLPPDCRELTPLEFIYKIWDTDKQLRVCSWPHPSTQVDPGITSVLQHMESLGDTYPS